jgi:hypothetical protein
MTVIITIAKPIKYNLLSREFAAVGFLQVSYYPGETSSERYVRVEDTNDTDGVTAVYDAHDAARLTPEEAATKAAITDYGNLTAWAKTGTAVAAETYINGQIWNGQTQAQVDAWIDANITGATVAALRTQVIAALKVTAGAIINMRGLFILTAKLLIYIRDLVIRFRTQ